MGVIEIKAMGLTVIEFKVDFIHIILISLLAENFAK